jgi:hypothetical protein
VRQTIARGTEGAAVGPERKRQPIRYDLLFQEGLGIGQLKDAAQLRIALIAEQCADGLVQQRL